MANLTVTIKEEVSLNGKEYGGVNTLDLTVTEVDTRIVTITNTEQTILLFDAAVAAGTFKDAQLEYLRITNLHESATVDLRISDSAQEYFVRVVAGGSFILTEDQLDADNTGSAETMSLAQIDSIKAISSTSTSDIEIFAAS
tara:strand:- start:1285 stop:1710 length:426 start_codon:yes stop_codon:yes gene_type:complete